MSVDVQTADCNWLKPRQENWNSEKDFKLFFKKSKLWQLSLFLTKTWHHDMNFEAMFCSLSLFSP
jgi:hypothetical protein